MLLEVTSSLSFPPADKTQCFANLSFNSDFQLINWSSSNLQNLLGNFNDRAIVIFSRIPLVSSGLGWAIVLANNLALYLQDLKSDSHLPQKFVLFA